jgi:CRP/FNR family cyclic AMP-dependent transcriptional regulator
MDYHKHKALEEGLADFFHSCHSKFYPAKQIMIRPGDDANTLYYIREGSVSVCLESEEGEELIVAYLNQGDFIGEIGYFYETGDRTVTIRAKTDVKTEEISYAQLRTLSETNLKGCYPLLLFTMGEQMASRLLSTTRKASDMAFLDVSGRVEAALHELAAQPTAMRHPLGKEIRATRQEISRMVGCSREMVGRVLKEMQEEGMIWAHGKTMIIFNEQHRFNTPVVRTLVK